MSGSSAATFSVRQHIKDFLNDWDPIGVNTNLRDAGLDADEYDEYVSAILVAVPEGTSAVAVALQKMLEDMGLRRSEGELMLRAQQLTGRLQG